MSDWDARLSDWYPDPADVPYGWCMGCGEMAHEHDGAQVIDGDWWCEDCAPEEDEG